MLSAVTSFSSSHVNLEMSGTGGLFDAVLSVIFLREALVSSYFFGLLFFSIFITLCLSLLLSVLLLTLFSSDR